MKIEAGKRYVTMNGTPTGPMEAIDNPSQFSAFIADFGSVRTTWGSDGRYSWSGDDRMTLVAEYHEPDQPEEEGLGALAEAVGEMRMREFGSVERPPLDPKGSEGAKKAPLHFLPSVAMHETSWVLAVGAAKYGPWNWRQNQVCASTYRSAMQRHLDQWYDEREDQDAESLRSHLAHVIASAAILLDAMKHGTLVDDRPHAASL